MMHGIDISNWQSGTNIPFTSVDFVICKATEGTGFVDAYCDGWVQKAKANGLSWGFYHFAGTGNAISEADWFIGNCEGYFYEGVPVLDWEGAQSVEWANDFVRRVHDMTGVWPKPTETWSRGSSARTATWPDAGPSTATCTTATLRAGPSTRRATEPRFPGRTFREPCMFWKIPTTK